jgi:hypothetical protein
MDEEKKGKPKKRRYYAVAARGIVYRYEMVDDIFFWSTLSAVLLFGIAIIIYMNVPIEAFHWICGILAGIQVSIFAALVIHHHRWNKRIQKGDRFTVLFDVDSKDYVLYMREGDIVSIPGAKVVDVRASFNGFFNPILAIFNLKERHIGYLTFVTKNSEGEENEVVVRDVDMPEIALLRVKIAKEKYLLEDVPDDEDIVETSEEGEIEEEAPEEAVAEEANEETSEEDDVENVAEADEIKVEE